MHTARPRVPWTDIPARLPFTFLVRRVSSSASCTSTLFLCFVSYAPFSSPLRRIVRMRAAVTVHAGECNHVIMLDPCMRVCVWMCMCVIMCACECGCAVHVDVRHGICEAILAFGVLQL